MRVNARSSRAVASAAPAVLAPVPVPTPEGPAYARGIIRNVAVVYQNGDEHAENVSGDVLVQGARLIPPNTRLLFEGSSFGADRAQVATACP